MKANVKSYMTAGVAIVGAGAIAMTPIAPPPAAPNSGIRTYEVSLTAMSEAAEARQQQFALASMSGGDPFAGLMDFIEGSVAAWKAPGPRPYVPVHGLIDGLGHIGQGVVATGLRLGETAIITPLRFLALAGAFAGGTGPQAVKDLVANLVDGPLWVADPVFYALRDALPAPLGGPGGLIEQFRNGIWAGTQEINAFILDPGAAVRAFVEGTMAAYKAPGPRPYVPVGGPFDGMARVVEGSIATGMRFIEASIVTPLRVLALAGQIAEGNGVVALRELITNIVDGPLWVVDPVLYGLRDAVPAVFGGGPGHLIEQFRNGLWQLTERINEVVTSLLQTPPTAPPASGLVGPESESSISSIPDLQVRVLNLPKKAPAIDGTDVVTAPVDGTDVVTAPTEGTDVVTAPVDETVPVDVDPVTVPVDVDPVTVPETGPVVVDPVKETVAIDETRNVVRESLNFSTGVKTGAERSESRKATQVAVDAISKVINSKVAAPKAGSAEAGGSETGAADQNKSEKSGSNE